MKAVPIKIVILSVVALIVVAGVWISIGAKVGSMDDYPNNDLDAASCESTLSKVQTLDFACNSQESSFQIMNDYLSLLEQEDMLHGEKLGEAWGGFRDSYMENYLNCKINHFRNMSWYGNEIGDAYQHLAFWKQRCSLDGYPQVGTIEGIRAEYQKYPPKEGHYQSEDQAKREIAQMKQFASNEYLKNCVTLQNRLAHFQSSMGDSHIQKVLDKEVKYRDPDGNFDEKREFEHDVNHTLAILQQYKDAAREGRYGRSHPKNDKVQKANDIVDNVNWP